MVTEYPMRSLKEAHFGGEIFLALLVSTEVSLVAKLLAVHRFFSGKITGPMEDCSAINFLVFILMLLMKIYLWPTLLMSKI
jgi:hypothetical protein